jgi:hypothetical protein
MPDAATALAEFAPRGTPDPTSPPARWPLALKVAFRFWAIYFTLYIFTTQMLGALIPFLPFHPGWTGPSRWLVEAVARNVFGVQTLVVTGSGSGDKTYDWIHAATYLVIAAALTIAWSVKARSADNHEVAHRRFRLFLRFALGTSLLSYGAAKFIPLQMPFPGLQRLLEPYGHFSPMGVLWASIGASPSYEIFTGVAEAAAGVLLFIPITAALGALVSLACAFQVFMLNMTYDVPVKLFSFHLVLMSIFLVAPHLKKLSAVVLEWPVAGRRLVIVQVVLAVLLLGYAIRGSMVAWTQYGGGAPKSPLYGIWNVTYMSIDGVERAPLVTDYARWRRAIFDRPTAMSFQRMDDTFEPLGAKFDTTTRTIALTRTGVPGWQSSFAYEQAGSNRLTLIGEMNGRKIEMRLDLVPRQSMLLVSRGFNWIQEYPFNR